MLRRLCCAVLAVAFAGGGLIHAEGTTTTLTRKQLRQLTASAHTRQDFETLASYYRQEAARYSQLSLAEEGEWKRELETPSVGAKYPTPADRARRLHEYYAEQARLCQEKSRLYESRMKQLEVSRAGNP